MFVDLHQSKKKIILEASQIGVFSSMHLRLRTNDKYDNGTTIDQKIRSFLLQKSEYQCCHQLHLQDLMPYYLMAFLVHIQILILFFSNFFYFISRQSFLVFLCFREFILNCCFLTSIIYLNAAGT